MASFSVNVVPAGGKLFSFYFSVADNTFYDADHAKSTCDDYTLEIDANGDVWGILTKGDHRVEGHLLRDSASIPDNDTFDDGEVFGFDAN